MVPTQSRSRFLPQFLCFGRLRTPPPPNSQRKKWFSIYAQSMWPESYSANVDILGRLHDIPDVAPMFLIIKQAGKNLFVWLLCDLKNHAISWRWHNRIIKKSSYLSTKAIMPCVLKKKKINENKAVLWALKNKHVPLYLARKVMSKTSENDLVKGLLTNSK